MGLQVRCFVCLAIGLLICGRHAGGDESAKAPIKKLILPGEAFLVQGRPAFVLLPPEKERRQPQPWVLYAPTLAGYPDEHEKWMREQFLAAGVAVAGIDVGEAYGSPRGRELFSALYQELTKKRGFANKPCGAAAEQASRNQPISASEKLSTPRGLRQPAVISTALR